VNAAQSQQSGPRNGITRHALSGQRLSPLSSRLSPRQKDFVQTFSWDSGYEMAMLAGLSLHDELALMVQAGLTPMEALQCATRNPARYLGRAVDLGTVEKGKHADLILLDANPVDEIKNTKRIAAVIVRGKLLRQETLRKMLADLKRAPTPNFPTIRRRRLSRNGSAGARRRRIQRSRLRRAHAKAGRWSCRTRPRAGVRRRGPSRRAAP
jgi:hypothetical protein